MKALMAALAIVALPATAFAATSESDVLSHYADLAHAKYEDSLIAARDLQDAVSQLIAEPTEANLASARDAWLAARVPYQQSEVYRFGNAVVDDWEGKVNAWPLDEGLIDYVAASYGAMSANVGGARAASALHQGAARRYAAPRRRRGQCGAPSSRTTERHATTRPTLGIRNLLISIWARTSGDRRLGRCRARDCFSDNTHASHYYDALGFRNIDLADVRALDGSVVQGPSVSDLVAAASADADAALRARLDATMAAMGEIVMAADAGEAYDQQIGEGNPAGNARVQAAIDALTAQTSAIEGAVAALNLAAIDFEGSDSLDDPEAVFE